MWEQIRSNRRKSIVLIALMAVLLGLLGAAIGLAIAPPSGSNPFRSLRAHLPATTTPAPLERTPDRTAHPSTADFHSSPFTLHSSATFLVDYAGGLVGLAAATALWAIWTLTAYFSGDRIFLALARAQRVGPLDQQRLTNVVEEMAIAAGLPTPPAVYVMDDPAINAFATGRTPQSSAIAVTSGALARLNRDQLQGVIAHEMSHIVNRDTLFVTMAGILVGSIALISSIFLRSLRYVNLGGGSARRSRGGSDGGGGQAALIFFLLALLLAIVAPILSQVLYFALSRRREYLADASAAMLTRYPEGLASALEAIARDSHTLSAVDRVTAPMYIANPLNLRSESSLGSTHPPIGRRIAILRAIAAPGPAGISYQAYEHALEAAGERRRGGLPPSALANDTRHRIRPPSPEPAPADARARMHDALDLTRQLAGFTFLACACGLRIKVPAAAAGLPGPAATGARGGIDSLPAAHMACPRCHRPLQMPQAQAATATAITAAAALAAATTAAAAGAPAQTPASADVHPSSRIAHPSASRLQSPASSLQPELSVRLATTGWTTIRCACGKAVNISPALLTDHIHCPVCDATIRIARGTTAAA